MIMRRHRPHIPRNYLYEPYGPDHVIARSIGEGTPWFNAWVFQYCTNYPTLKKLTGITIERADALSRGATITRAELDVLAKACGAQPSDIIASLPDPQLLKD